MQFTDAIACEPGSAVHQMRQQLEAGRGGALVIACSDHTAAIEVFCRRAGGDGALVLRVRGPDLRRTGVAEAITRAAINTSLRSITVLGHSGCHHALEHCPDLPAHPPTTDDVIGRLTRGARQQGLLIEAAHRTVRASVRALSTLQSLKPAIESGALRLDGAVLLVESGVWRRYHREADAFVADLEARAA